MVLDAVYSPHWLTADRSLLAGEHEGFADVNDNEVTSSGRCLTMLFAPAHYHHHKPGAQRLLESDASLIMPWLHVK